MKRWLVAPTVAGSIILSGCGNSVIEKDWDVLSSLQRQQICEGVRQFGPDTAAALEYTPNGEYTKDDLARFLEGKC